MYAKLQICKRKSPKEFSVQKKKKKKKTQQQIKASTNRFKGNRVHLKLVIKLGSVLSVLLVLKL
jgi:hypothetical protein